jgi:hypothetical protein
MKKIHLMIAFLAIAGFRSSAQTEKGKAIFGGTFAFDAEKQEGSNQSATSLTILPTIGTFVEKNAAIGIGAGYVYNFVPDESKAKAFIIGPFVRGYKRVSDQFSFFTDFGFAVGFGREENTSAITGPALGPTDYRSSSVAAGISPGFAFFPTKKVAFELSLNGLNYQTRVLKDKNGNRIDGSRTTTYSAGADFFTPQLGIQFHF